MTGLNGVVRPGALSGGAGVGLVIVAALLAGCSTVPAPKRLLTSKQIQDGRFEPLPAEKSFKALYNASLDAPADEALANAYLTRGMLESRTTCLEYLEDRAIQGQKLEYARNQLTVTAVLATGVLAMAGANRDLYQGLALGTAFAYSSADLYRDSLLLGPDSQVIIDLIDKSLTAAQETIANNPSRTHAEALGNLQWYSGLCTLPQVRETVKKALQKANPKISYTAELETVADRAPLADLAKLFDVFTITPSQLSAIYWLVADDAANAAEKAEIVTRLGSLKGVLFDNATPPALTAAGKTKLQDARRILLGISLGLESKLKASIAEFRAAQAKREAEAQAAKKAAEAATATNNAANATHQADAAQERVRVARQAATEAANEKTQAQEQREQAAAMPLPGEASAPNTPQRNEAAIQAAAERVRQADRQLLKAQQNEAQAANDAQQWEIYARVQRDAANDAALAARELSAAARAAAEQQAMAVARVRGGRGVPQLDF